MDNFGVGLAFFTGQASEKYTFLQPKVSRLQRVRETRDWAFPSRVNVATDTHPNGLPVILGAWDLGTHFSGVFETLCPPRLVESFRDKGEGSLARQRKLGIVEHGEWAGRAALLRAITRFGREADPPFSVRLGSLKKTEFYCRGQIVCSNYGRTAKQKKELSLPEVMK